MNRYQLNYAKALAQYRTATEERQKKADPYWRSYDKGKLTIDEIVNKETLIDKEVGYTRALNAKITAENELIEWTQKHIRQNYPSRYDSVKDAFDKGRRHPHFKDKLIDICMRYKPDERISRSPHRKTVRITPKRPRIR